MVSDFFRKFAAKDRIKYGVPGIVFHAYRPGIYSLANGSGDAVPDKGGYRDNRCIILRHKKPNGISDENTDKNRHSVTRWEYF